MGMVIFLKKVSVLEKGDFGVIKTTWLALI